MSYSIIRNALEIRLAELDIDIVTAWENVSLVPPNEMYQRAYLLPAGTNNPDFGNGLSRETGILQVSVVAPQGTGPSDCIAQAELIRTWFPRGLSLVNSGLTVIISKTPSIAPAIYEEKNYVIPVSIPFYCDVYN